MKRSALLFIAGITISGSCKNDNNTTPATAPLSRNISYELTGNFTGNTLFASYTTASGGTANEQVSSLPWTKQITYQNKVSAAIIAISGGGGVPGQQVTITIKREGKTVGTPTPATANESGGFSVSGPVITF